MNTTEGAIDMGTVVVTEFVSVDGVIDDAGGVFPDADESRALPLVESRPVGACPIVACEPAVKGGGS
jgi:hypothetical protein